jgi:hypothetical protein
MLEVVISACLIGALLLFGYSAYALRREMDAQEAAKNVVEKVADKVVLPPARTIERPHGLDDATGLQSLLGPDNVIKALADLGDALSKLRASVAALLIAFGLVVFAGIFAAVDDKVSDSDTSAPQTTTLPH